MQLEQLLHVTTPEIAQIVTQKSSTAQSRNATLEIPMANVIPC